MNEYEKKIAALREKYTRDDGTKEVIDQTEAEMKRLLAEKEVKNYPAFQAIAKDAQKKLDEINALLMTSPNLTDLERSKLFAQKECWKFVSDRFGFGLVDGALIELEKFIDAKLQG